MLLLDRECGRARDGSLPVPGRHLQLVRARRDALQREARDVLYAPLRVGRVQLRGYAREYLARLPKLYGQLRRRRGAPRRVDREEEWELLARLLSHGLARVRVLEAVAGLKR